MNTKASSFLKNLSYTASSNVISMIISTIVVLLVPKLIGIEDYGYWQLYLFYTSYVGFLHFGWNDGIYLRYGGKEYKDLNRPLFFNQFWMMLFFQVIIGIIIISLSSSLSNDAERLFIINVTVLCMLIVNVRLMLVYILQSTNRIKEYAQITMLEKLIYLSLILLFLFLGFTEFKILILADLIGKLVSLLYSTYCCKEIVFNNISYFYFNFKETIENVNVGIKLMIANIAGMLTIGIVRFGIERGWDVSTFGKVSLTLSVSNLLMLFINAVGIIMFPILRRTNVENLPNIYSTMRTFLMTALLGLLLAYYPLNYLLSAWLPQYLDSLKYMALLFPMCLYEGKMALLINTYFKTLRKEKAMLYINLVSVIASLIVTVIFTVINKNLSVAVVSIVVILAFKCILAELYLSKLLNVSVIKDIILELTLTFIFILTGWFVSPFFGILLYIGGYCLYLLVKRTDIRDTVLNMKKFVKV